MSCAVLLKYYYLGAFMKLSTKKQLRVDILTKYISGKIYYLDAIQSLEISERQFRRLVKEFKKEGIQSIVHGNSGKSPPNKMKASDVTKIVRLYKTIYSGMNVVHFLEKLKELEDMTPPSYSTLRNILLRENLISPTMKRKKRNYPRRVRYEKEGLMVQIDGSHHRWIYGEEMFCLTAAIDDATGKILGGKFTKTETTFAAMDVVEQIIKNYGVFQMLYSDRAGIYGGKRDGYSNMNRAMRELGVVPVQAYSPQAKGRVERLFKTLQGRLVSEMRLAGIKNIDEANEFLLNYIEVFNQQFGKRAKSVEVAYKKLPRDVNLDEVFTMVTHRKVQSGEVISFKNQKFVLRTRESLAGHEADLKHYRDGRLEIFVKGEKVDFMEFEELKNAA